MILKRRKNIASMPDQLAHERLVSLINSMADGVLAVDKNVRVVIYNGAALNILDRNDPIERKSLDDIFRPLNKDDERVNVTKLVQGTTVPTSNRDLKLTYSDGSVINLYISIAPVRLGYGEQGQQGYVILLRDISHEKSLEEERDEFISVVSHELRTPIAITEGNIGNAEFIVEKSGDLDKVKQALHEAHNQILFLASLVNDLAMLSRAERGVTPIDVESIDVTGLLEELVHNYGEQASAKGLKLTSHIIGDRQPELVCSKLYVREVLQNFITNSIKYTEAGSITISAEGIPDGVKFSVSDTGIGISKPDQQKVFQKFFRSGDYRTTKATGTGLGLYVTAKLARLLNAHITLDSELNKGSTFAISVPNMPTSKAMAPDTTPTLLSGPSHA